MKGETLFNLNCLSSMLCLYTGTGETETNPNPVGSGKPVGAEDLNSGTGTSYSSLQKPLRSEFGGKWVWGYFNTMRDAAGKKVVEALCKLCQTKVSPKNHRLTAHLEKAHWEEVPQLCGVRSSMYGKRFNCA